MRWQRLSNRDLMDLHYALKMTLETVQMSGVRRKRLEELEREWDESIRAVAELSA